MTSEPQQKTAPEKLREGGVRRPYLPWWRRNYMVNRELQLKYAGSALLMGLVCSISSLAILLISFWSFGIWQGQRLPGMVIAAIIFAILVNLVGIMLTSILSTQRIVGPLFNLLKQFQRVSRGDFKAQAKFRANDEIHYVARRFNEMLQRLDDRETEIFTHLDRAYDALENNQTTEALEALNQARHLRSRALGASENAP
ncbi:MAG: HAMP domain-containing protein [Betaproteobacteria bacterium]|nr:HAMP domain-containing protein [Betaproteobacteria bacterium]